MSDKTFAEGIYFDLPREGAPDFVKGRMSFKVAEAVVFLQKHENNAGYVNLDLKVGKSGKAYAELNTYVPTKPEGLKEEAAEEESEIPF
jgi:hypothetical protein